MDHAPALSEGQMLARSAEAEAVIVRSTRWSRCNYMSRDSGAMEEEPGLLLPAGHGGLAWLGAMKQVAA